MPTTDVHHSHGKIGALLFFFPWFRAVCRQCHDWIEANKEGARKLGMECERGEFNTQADQSTFVLKWKEGRSVKRIYFTTIKESAEFASEQIGNNFRRKYPGKDYEIALIE